MRVPARAFHLLAVLIVYVFANALAQLLPVEGEQRFKIPRLAGRLVRRAQQFVERRDQVVIGAGHPHGRTLDGRDFHAGGMNVFHGLLKGQAIVHQALDDHFVVEQRGMRVPGCERLQGKA